jgi:predicted HNH restriction endonuclease
MSRVFEMQNTPSVAEYVRVLSAFGQRVTDEHRELFRCHYLAPNRTATAKQLASLAGIAGGWTVVNPRYGKLGHALCDELGIKPDLRPDFTHRWWSVWSRGWNTPEGFVWQMLPKVAEALEQLGWVGPARFVSPDEIVSDVPLVEGAVCRITVNAYERNPEARERCIEVHGSACCICGFDFGTVYGHEFAGFIHVHHRLPLSEIGGEYVIDPVEGLQPVCPNCHAIIHHGGRLRGIDEVCELLDQSRRTRACIRAADRGGI